MAHTLKDVYIKVTEKNRKEIERILHPCGLIGVSSVGFVYDDITSWYCNTQKGQKVSLSELKRLIDTIPTREEITRLKRQISAYKTNYDKVVKHSMSKEDVINNIEKNNSELIQKLINANRYLKSKYSEIQKLKDDIKKVRGERDSLDASYKNLNEMYDDLVLESGKKQSLLKNLYDDALKSVDFYKGQLITQENRHNDFVSYKNLEHKNEIDDFKENIASLRNELERLKNKKWYQIWK